MAYTPPVITASGLSVPSYADILASLLATYQSIYGTTTYLEDDAADYQWVSALALKLNDNTGLCQLAYNARSPLTAIGADLDAVVKLNGIARLIQSYSTVVLLLTGVSGTPINNGVVADENGIFWTLPSLVTIGVAGTVSVAAVCQQSGAVSANENTVTKPVGGFTAGWTGVTNPAPAVVGLPIESDSNLRARQAISVALPSETRLAGTVAGIAQTPGVTRFNILENPTGTTDGFGNLPHSLTCVVEGGTDLAVATAIYDNRGIGCNTQGATVPVMKIVDVTDPNSGNITAIGFVRPVVPVTAIGILVHPLSASYTSQTGLDIYNAVVAYINSIGIGEEITQSAIYAAAMSATPNLAIPLFSIRAVYLGTTAGAILAGVLINGGTGFSSGDIGATLTVAGGGSGGTFTITAVAGGKVTGINPLPASGGTGYGVGTFAASGGSGTGVTIQISTTPTGTSDIALPFYEVPFVGGDDVQIGVI